MQHPGIIFDSYGHVSSLLCSFMFILCYIMNFLYSIKLIHLKPRISCCFRHYPPRLSSMVYPSQYITTFNIVKETQKLIAGDLRFEIMCISPRKKQMIKHDHPRLIHHPNATIHHRFRCIPDTVTFRKYK